MLPRLLAPLLLVGWLSGHAWQTSALRGPAGQPLRLEEVAPGARLLLLLGDEALPEAALLEAERALNARGVRLVVLTTSPRAAASLLVLEDPGGALHRALGGGAVLQGPEGEVLLRVAGSALQGVALERVLAEIDALGRRPSRAALCPRSGP